MDIRLSIKFFVLGMVLSFLFFNSCKKADWESSQIYPKVEITSAAYDPSNASIRVTGKVINKGGSNIAEVGFLLSDSPDAQMELNRGKAELNGDEFSYTYYVFEPEVDTLDVELDHLLFIRGRTVYVQAYAFNSEGFGVSKIAEVGPCNGLDITPGCSPQQGILVLGSDEFEVYGNYFLISNMSKVRISFATDEGTVLFIFNKVPVPGIYSTVPELEGAGPDAVVVTLSYDYYLEAGNQVYVEDWEDNQLRITVCTSSFEGWNNTFTAQFLVKECE